MSMDYLRGLSPFNQLPAHTHSGQNTHTHLLIMWPRIEPLSLIIHDVPQKVDAVLPVTHKWGTFPPPCDKVSLRKVRRDVISWCCSVCTWDKRLLLAFAPYVFANSLTVNWKDWGLKAHPWLRGADLTGHFFPLLSAAWDFYQYAHQWLFVVLWRGCNRDVFTKEQEIRGKNEEIL